MNSFLGHFGTFSSNERTIKDRLYNLRYKLFLGTFKPSGYIYRDTDNLHQYFFSYLASYIIPKYFRLRTPCQIIYKSCLLPVISYEDLELVDEYNNVSLLKRKRIIRLFEESAEQGRPLSYSDIAYLTFTTKNTVSKWINDVTNTGFTLQPNKYSGLPSRKTHIAEQYIKGILLKKYSSETYKTNLENDYTTVAEATWFLCEFLISCLVHLYNNPAAKDFLNKMSINDHQFNQFMELYLQYKDVIDSKYNNDYFKAAAKSQDTIEIIALTIQAADSRLGAAEEITQRINKYIDYYKNNRSDLEELSIGLYLKDCAINKHQVYHSSDILKLVSLKIYDTALAKGFKGISNKELIAHTITSLKHQAEAQGVHITESDISFIMGISRDTVQRYV